MHSRISERSSIRIMSLVTASSDCALSANRVCPCAFLDDNRPSRLRMPSGSTAPHPPRFNRRGRPSLDPSPNFHPCFDALIQNLYETFNFASEPCYSNRPGIHHCQEGTTSLDVVTAVGKIILASHDFTTSDASLLTTNDRIGEASSQGGDQDLGFIQLSTHQASASRQHSCSGRKI